MPPTEIASLVTGQLDENLGNSTEVFPDSREFHTVLQLAAKEPSAGELVTVHLSSERASFLGPEALDVPNAIARLEFGSGSARSGFLEVDWDHGTQITVPADSLRISAGYPGDTIALDSIRCSAFVVRGARAHGPGPRRTLTSQALDSRAVRIPRGAKALTVWDILTPSPVLWLDHAGEAIGFFEVLQFGNPPPGPVPVPPDAREVLMFGPHIARLVFDIDG